MARTSVAPTIKPTEELVELVTRFEASNIVALERAAAAAEAIRGLEPFALADLNPVVIPRAYLDRILDRGRELAGALEPFTLDPDDAA